MRIADADETCAFVGQAVGAVAGHARAIAELGESHFVPFGAGSDRHVADFGKSVGVVEDLEWSGNAAWKLDKGKPAEQHQAAVVAASGPEAVGVGEVLDNKRKLIAQSRDEFGTLGFLEDLLERDDVIAAGDDPF